MFPVLSNRLDIYLFAEATDMRKSIDGLAALVEFHLGKSAVSDQLFVFCNRNRDKIKILQWANNGFWLHYKRLERDCFHWPDRMTRPGEMINHQQLNWLLDGLPMVQPDAHKALTICFD
jgi:transposase